MIIGRTFAIGHIPKTAGDAVHKWCQAIGDPDLIIDSIVTNPKHDPFSVRPEATGKRWYVLSIRRLPEWLLSLLNEDSLQPQLVKQWGFGSPSDLKKPEAAFRHAYADYHIARMRQGVEISHWMRAGAGLLDDLIATVSAVHRPLTDQETARMKGAVVKQPRPYDHDIHKHWSRREIETLYRLNPQWAAIESMVFGGLWK